MHARVSAVVSSEAGPQRNTRTTIDEPSRTGAIDVSAVMYISTSRNSLDRYEVRGLKE